MVDSTDEQLMERFCQGDHAAFEALFDRYGVKVRAYLRPMVKDPQLAEDLTQVTFLSMIRARDRYQRAAPVAPWIFTIAANAARDALRRRTVEKAAVSADPPETSVLPETKDHGLRRELEAALDKLPVTQREAVVLHKVQGFSFEQVAESLGITSTAARIRAHRGYEKLRVLLAHLEGP